jgi:hypothetical protein
MIQTVANITSPRANDGRVVDSASGVDVAKREDGVFTIRTWKEDAFGVLTSGPAAEFNEDQVTLLATQIIAFIAAGELESELQRLVEGEDWPFYPGCDYAGCDDQAQGDGRPFCGAHHNKDEGEA